MLRSIIVASLVACAACAGAQDRYGYEDLSARFGYPVAESSLPADVLGDDQARVRRHAWELWAALIAPSQSVVDGQRLPAFLKVDFMWSVALKNVAP